MNRRELLTGAALLAGAGQANAFGIGGMGRRLGRGGLLGGASSFTPAFASAPAAYGLWGYEQLVPTYTGPLIKALRVSDSATLDFSALTSGPYKGQLDRAAVIAWAGTSMVRVRQKYDQSGNGRHMVNTFAPQQPVLDISTPFAAEYYPATSIAGFDFQSIAYTGSFASGQANLAIGAVSKTCLSTSGVLLGGITYGASSYLKILNNTDGTAELAVKKADADTGDTIASSSMGWSNPYIGLLAEADFTNNVSRLSINGAASSATTGGSGVTPTGSFSVSTGGAGATQNQGFNRVVCMYTAAISTADRTAINAALTTVANRSKIGAIVVWGDSISAYGATLNTQYGYYRIVQTNTFSGQTSTTVKNAMVADTKYPFFNLSLNVGRNNFNAQATVLSDIAAMWAYSKTDPSKKRVNSILNSNTPSGVEWIGGTDYATILALNSAIAAVYGSQYLDNRSNMVAGYNSGNALDVIDFGHDVPPFLMRGSLTGGTLSASLDAVSTSFVLNGTTQVVAGAILLIDSEYIEVIFGSSGNVSSCIRGYAGSTAASHASGTAPQMIDPLHPGSLGNTRIASLTVASGL